MLGINQLRERVAILERDIKGIKQVVSGAVPVAMLDHDKGYVLIVPEDTTDEECEELSNVFRDIEGFVVRGNKFKILEVS